jgi:hypothetical protein
MDKFFESLTEYAGSICVDSVSEDVAQEMRIHSSDSSSSSTAVTSSLETSPNMSEELMTLVIGNTHRLVIPTAGSPNQHLWTFYLLASRPEIIKEVRVHLVSSFRANINLQVMKKVVLIKRLYSASDFRPTLSYI